MYYIMTSMNSIAPFCSCIGLASGGNLSVSEPNRLEGRVCAKAPANLHYKPQEPASLALLAAAWAPMEATGCGSLLGETHRGAVEG